MQIGEAFVAVRPDTSKFGPELNRDMQQSGKQAASGLSQALTAGIAVAGFAKIIGAASSLEEASNKVSVTFGESAGQVEAFASTSAESLGIAESAALSLAGGIGSMLIPLGIGQEEAAGMSTAMLALASDMGSFNDQDPTEMLERIRSGLAGESEPLRQFGANLSEARVQQFAWAEGITESGEALTEQDKVMARYGLLLQDTTIQQGDFARTATSAANAQRTAAATAEDSAASIGENFIPVYEQAVAAVTLLAGAFGALPGPLQTAGVLLGGYIAFRVPLTAAFGAMAGSVGMLRKALLTLRGSLFVASAAWSTFGASALATAGPFAALAGILVAIHTGLIDVTNAMTATDLDTQNVDKMTAAMIDAGSASEGLVDHLSDADEFDPSFFDALGTNVDQFADALLGGEDQWNQFVELVTGNLPEGADLGQWTEALELHRTRAQASATAMEEQETAATNAALGLDANATSAEQNAAALDVLSEAIDTYLDKIQSTEEAAAGEAEAQRALFDALVANGATFDVNTQKGRDNIAARNEWVDAVGAQVQAAFDFAAAGGNVEVAQRRANNAVRSGIDDLRAMRDAGLITGEQFRILRGQMEGIPTRITPEIRERGAEETGRAADDVTAAVKRIPKFGRVELTANNRQAMSAIAEARRAAEAWAAMTYEAQIRVSTQGLSPINAAHGRETASDLAGVPLESGAAMPSVHVTVNGSIVGDVERFADEIAYRAAEKLSMTGGL